MVDSFAKNPGTVTCQNINHKIPLQYWSISSSFHQLWLASLRYERRVPLMASSSKTTSINWTIKTNSMGRGFIFSSLRPFTKFWRRPKLFSANIGLFTCQPASRISSGLKCLETPTWLFTSDRGQSLNRSATTLTFDHIIKIFKFWDPRWRPRVKEVEFSKNLFTSVILILGDSKFHL